MENVRILVATPETLSGLLSADQDFLQRASLVICDEGHLLDGQSRGVGLELLLARMKVRSGGPPRFVFISAIVPNIEEINLWLGGAPDSVVRSTYRPSIAEYSVLRSLNQTASSPVTLEMHPHERSPFRYSINNFLTKLDFQYRNSSTGRIKTFPFSSIKTRTIAAARKVMQMGTVAVFSANKGGNQGAVGLAGELISQLNAALPLPNPIDFSSRELVREAVEYLHNEYGESWIGTKALSAGAVLHHGDIPQETREVVESLLRTGAIRLAICTSTLAEGVNLPIRTLILYSVLRRQIGGGSVSLLARDIKNLVGRVGRAGATTKGLVICANEHQWHTIEPVARQVAGEPVVGALRQLIERLRDALAGATQVLTNDIIESEPQLHSLIDGIDATLIDLAAEEIGAQRLEEIALQVANQTFASIQMDDVSKGIMNSVFKLRANKITSIQQAGRIEWMRETGARTRVLDAVESGLLPKIQELGVTISPTDPRLVDILLNWAWAQKDIEAAIRSSYRIDAESDIEAYREPFFSSVRIWLSGGTFAESASRLNRTVDDTLQTHTSLVSFALQTLIEQAIPLLSKLLESRFEIMDPDIEQFPNHLRFGVSSPLSCVLAGAGMRHRRSAIALAEAEEMRDISPDDRETLFFTAKRLLTDQADRWRTQLGSLVYRHSLIDVASLGRE